jgi:hypothetical protein
MVSLNCDMLQIKKILVYHPKGFRYHFEEQHSCRSPIPTVNKKYLLLLRGFEISFSQLLIWLNYQGYYANRQ